ncbi:MAG TPA: hypothetical protein ENK66_08330 [Arcobacter sp.]|jgi:hypothetical protein|nr:hypothetical protein [Arcobacter sp.]
MKLPNWFKIIWWIASLLLFGFLLFTQFDLIKNGKSTSIDIFILLIFVILLLSPLFSEFELFGIKLKQEIEDLKKNIDIKLGNIRNDINNTQTVTNNFAGINAPSSDETIKKLEKKLDEIINNQSKPEDFSLENSSLESMTFVPENNIMMFKIRFNIENEIRRIWQIKFSEKENRYKPIVKMMNELVTYNIINQDLYNILREVLSICNIGIHEDKLTEKQVSFVMKHSDEIIHYLKNFD